MLSDNEVLLLLEDRISNSFLKTDSCLTIDDQYLYRILKDPDRLTSCPLCGGEIKHSIISRCAGHGDFPRYVVFSCQGLCKFSFDSRISFGNSYFDARFKYLEYAHNLKSSIKC